MDTQERFPEQPADDQALPPPPPPARRRRSKWAVIATAIATAVVAIAVRMIVGGAIDATVAERPRNVLLQDDFSDQRGGWITGRNDTRDLA